MVCVVFIAFVYGETENNLVTCQSMDATYLTFILTVLDYLNHWEIGWQLLELLQPVYPMDDDGQIIYRFCTVPLQVTGTHNKKQQSSLNTQFYYEEYRLSIF